MANEPATRTEAKVALNNEQRRLEYNKTVRKAELRAILLSEVNFKVNRDLDIDDSLRPSYGGEVINFSYDPGRGACVARVQWIVDIKVNRRRLARCVAKYDAVYDGLECDEEIAKLFVENVAKSATYSYFRALYASLDWGADFGSRPLPIMKFMPKV